MNIVTNGFPDRYKPTGKVFYACAENRLMHITCWRYEYANEVVVSREMCLVMNELARVISKQMDEWWKEKLLKKVAFCNLFTYLHLYYSGYKKIFV